MIEATLSDIDGAKMAMSGKQGGTEAAAKFPNRTAGSEGIGHRAGGKGVVPEAVQAKTYDSVVQAAAVGPCGGSCRGVGRRTESQGPGARADQSGNAGGPHRIGRADRLRIAAKGPARTGAAILRRVSQRAVMPAEHPANPPYVILEWSAGVRLGGAGPSFGQSIGIRNQPPRWMPRFEDLTREHRDVAGRHERRGLLATVAAAPKVVEEKWPDGKIKVRREMGEDLHGRLVPHGMETRYDPDGVKLAETSYRLGDMDGPWREFYLNGKTKIEGNYRRGKKEGPEISYTDDGQKVKEVNYHDDQKQGKTIEWLAGHKISEAEYDNDELVGTRQGMDRWAASPR